MKERKYINDWVNEVRLDEKTGRDRRVPVYTGIWYKTDAKSGSLAVSRGTCLIPFAVCFVLTILFFIADDAATRSLPVFLPAAAALFPMFYWALGVWSLLRLKERFTRVQREKSYGRIMHSSMGCMICLGIAFVGNISRILANGPVPGDITGSAALLCAAAAAFLAFRHQRIMEGHIKEYKETGDGL
ncbi:MAG: hypothetical protein IKI84_09345 [Clostridia bacterium]|nr:hypothetical protein [Clostridia bacterium]